MRLPIDVVPGPNGGPPRFRWQQLVHSPEGNVVVDHEGCLDPAVEVAVDRLLRITKHALAENQALRQQVQGLSDKLVAKGEEVERIEAEVKSLAETKVEVKQPEKKVKR